MKKLIKLKLDFWRCGVCSEKLISFSQQLEKLSSLKTLYINLVNNNVEEKEGIILG